MTEMPDEIWISDIEGSHCRCWNGPTYGGFKGEGHLSTKYVRADMIQQWQPMETAPKDSTPVLIFCEKGPVKRIDVAQYFTREGADLDGWYTQNLGYYGCDVVKCWMSLPKVPE